MVSREWICEEIKIREENLQANDPKLKGQRTLAQARCLAHWTFTQRTIHVVLPIKPSILRHEKSFPTGTAGDLIRARRIATGLTREQLSKATGIPLHWLGRWERDRALPSETEWQVLSSVLPLGLEFSRLKPHRS
jgi:DNA-binding transcriptional regulator YiaG